MDYITTPHQAELSAQDQMRSWGFVDAVATTGGADGGIDVRARSALAQVKWKAGVTGRPEIQQLHGARGNGSEQLYFFSASGYSDQAVAYADEVGVLLMIYDPLGEVTGANTAAQQYLETVVQGQVRTDDESTDWRLVSILTAVLVVLTSVTVLLWWP